LQQLKHKFDSHGVSSNSAQFILLVDVDQCQTKEIFKSDKKEDYKYYIIGGNYSISAKLNLGKIKSNYSPFKGIQAFAYIGLMVLKARESCFRSQH
jgi:hypothetical protein